MRALAWCVLAGLSPVCLSTAQAAPASFHRAVGTLSPTLLVKRLDADTYSASDNVRIRYDAATPGILITRTSIPLGDQGLAVATALLPGWCDLNIAHPPVGALTDQMARSARLRLKVEAGKVTSTLVRSRVGRCEAQTFSNSLESFVLLKQVKGPAVWPLDID